MNKPESTDRQRLTTEELLCQELADLKALAIVNGFTVLTMLEAMGIDAAPLLAAVNQLNREIGDLTEARLREHLGLEPRAVLREHLYSIEQMRKMDWTEGARL